MEIKSCHTIHKKDDPKNKSNYRPISLLCNISKIFERLVPKLYSFLQHNTLLSSNNSGFHSGDSTINQLTSITHIIYKAIDKGKDIRVVFLDMSKAFDKVWHKGIVHKLKCKGVSGSLLMWFESYLEGRRQRVVIDGSFSDYQPVKAGVPQGSILGPLLFLVLEKIYISRIRLMIEYGNVLYDNCPKYLSDRLESVQLNAAHAPVPFHNLTVKKLSLKLAGKPCKLVENGTNSFICTK